MYVAAFEGEKGRFKKADQRERQGSKRGCCGDEADGVVFSTRTTDLSFYLKVKRM
jgi:hypothetical protein